MDAPCIVFVDNEPGVLSALRRLLRLSHRDWEMYFFSTSSEALHRLSELSPWVVVADRDLAEVAGIELLGKVARMVPQAVRVLLCGDARMESALEATAAAHMVLRKPFEQAVIDDLLTRARVLHQLPMSDTLRSRLGQREHLPVLPKVYQQITQELGRQEPDVAKVAELIRHDQVLLSRVLQLVNSPFFGFNSRTNDVEVAVMRLGLQTIHNLVLIIELYQHDSSVPPALGERLMREALLLAEQVSALCAGRGVGKNTRNQALVGALLHNIGQLLLSDQPLSPEGYSEYPLASAYLLELWGLDAEVIEAVQHQLDPEPPPERELATEILNTALKLRRGILQGGGGDGE
ncbi:MAG: HDOD domain-containing protein [Pseudomonadota bacterium]|jgi:HD-like signal output (HDOD) protein|nr:HDOD domain-containing protein [Pseudomonadota bacterium]